VPEIVEKWKGMLLKARLLPYTQPYFIVKGYAYDTMPEFDPDGTILGNLIKQFQNRIINVAFLQITPETKKMEEHFQQTYNLHSKSYKIHHQ